MKRLFLLLVAILMLPAAAEAVPEYFNYQARIFDASGAPLQGARNLSFTIYDATQAGNIVWGPFTCDGQTGDGHADRAVVWDGWFNVIIGPRDTSGRSVLQAFLTYDANPRFIEVSVEGATITPRQQLLAAPYAMRAAQADEAKHALNGVPPGCIMAYYGELAPSGWLICDGTAIPPGVEYDELRNLIGPNTPDLRGRSLLMADPTGVALDYYRPAFGNMGGEERHLLTVPEMPVHSHSFSVNTNGYPDGGADTNPSKYEYWNRWHSPWDVIGTSNSGGDQPHNNLPPYLAVNFIIKY